MAKTKELFEDAISLPIEVKTQLIDKLLHSINPIQKEIDELWAKEAESRVNEIHKGTVNAVPSEKIFKKIFNR